MSRITETRKERIFEEVDGKLKRREAKIPAERRVEWYCGKHKTMHLMSRGQIINCNK